MHSDFASKEELFMEIVVKATEPQFDATFGARDPSVDGIRQALAGFGLRFLSQL